MEYTFDWRIYMKKVPIKELREDLKEELKEELVPDSAILDEKKMGEELYHKLEIRREICCREVRQESPCFCSIFAEHFCISVCHIHYSVYFLMQFRQRYVTG